MTLVVTWHVYPDGIHLWENGKFLTVIPRADMLAIIAACARELQNAR